MQKKKVLFVATVVKTHIMQFHIPYLKMFQEMGWETAVASKNDYENPDDCKIPYCDIYYDIPFERTPWKLKNFKSYKMLKKIIDEGNYDFIHCHTPVGAMITRLAALSARKQGTKLFYTAHGFHFFKGAPLKNWLLYYPIEKIFSYFTDVLITINQEDYRLAQKKMKASRVEYIPGVGVDVEKFRDTHVDRKQKCAEIGIPEDATLLLSVGELNRNKNQQVIIRALAQLHDSDIHYVVVGVGDQVQTLKNLAEELGVSQQVHFLGYRQDVAELCHTADIFCFPSQREGLGLAAVEAMAAGLPIIAADNRGTREYMVNGETGFVCHYEEVSSFSDAIKKLKNDASLRREIKITNQDRVPNFDIKEVILRMEKIYEEDGTKALHL